MRVGLTIFCQNTGDWDRYEAEERGEDVAARPSKADAEIFREEVGLALMADNLGFDSVWTVEHHFTPYTMVTNPLQLLTYLSGVTKNVDLGSMVVVLPWHNPVRVAEDVAMLDMLLGPDRQIMCGVGRGLGRREYDGMNIDQATQVMLHVHQNGVGECGVYTYEVAETKVTLVMDYAKKNQHPLQCVPIPKCALWLQHCVF